MVLSALDRPGEWTLDLAAQLPQDGRRWEVVDGRLVQMSPPTTLHDHIVQRLARQLDRQAPPGLVVLSQFGLRLGDDGRLPDVGVLRDVPFSRSQVGTPAEHALLLAEVVSESTRKTDRFFKPAEYADAGIPHYWRIETDPELFVVTHELVGGRYEQTGGLRGRHELPAPYAMVLDVPALLPDLFEG